MSDSGRVAVGLGWVCGVGLVGFGECVAAAGVKERGLCFCHLI